MDCEKDEDYICLTAIIIAKVICQFWVQICNFHVKEWRIISTFFISKMQYSLLFYNIFYYFTNSCGKYYDGRKYTNNKNISKVKKNKNFTNDTRKPKNKKLYSIQEHRG